MKRIPVIIPLLAVLAALSILPACPLPAAEIDLLGGIGATNHPVETAGSWQVRYMEGLGEDFAFSLAYLNQGHFSTHRRDGTAASLWLRTNEFHPQLSLAVGAGPFFYYDTVIPESGKASDVHGWGTLVNLLASWYTKNRWIYQLQASWVRGGNSFDTFSLLAGIGYQLDPPPSPGPALKAVRQSGKSTENELTVLGGQTVVNIPGKGKSAAGAIEYRRGLWRYVEWTAGVLYEGKSDLIERHGITSQLWLAKLFFDDRLDLAAGLGFYLAEDRLREDRGGAFLSEVVSITASYRLAPQWNIRGLWKRIVTDYDRDSDLFLAGVGYRF
jgi:hypothetical protein